MDIDEFNKIIDNQIPEFSLPDNLKTSDELDTHSTDYVEYGKTLYARNNKIKKASKTAGIISSFSAIGILTGTFIFSSSNILKNTFIGTTPNLLRRPCFLSINNSIYYSLNLENEGNLNSYLIIKNKDNNKENKMDISSSNDYLNHVDNLDNGNYLISSLVTNSNDYNNTSLLFNEFDIDLINADSFKVIDSKLKYSFFFNNLDKNYNSYLNIDDNNIINKIELFNNQYNEGEIFINSNINIKITLEKYSSNEEITLYYEDISWR